MPVDHFATEWIAVLALLVPITLGTGIFLLVDRSRLQRERAALLMREKGTRQAIENIAESMQVALFFMRQDAHGRCSFPQVVGHPERFMDCRAEQIIANSENWMRCLPDADRAIFRKAVAHSLANSQHIFAELRVRRRDGNGWIRVGTGLPRRRPDGSVLWTGYWADTTLEHDQARALAKARQAAEAGAEAKARFLATISHEIRTPLATVIGALDLLRDTGLRAEQQEPYQLADNAARLLMEIIGDILDFSRLESGHIEPEAVPFDLRAVLSQVLNVFQPQVRHKGLALILDVEPAVAPALIGDPTRVQQIVLNLVGNAVKFTERGEVRLGVRLGPGSDSGLQYVVFTVADTGIGIPESAQDSLFQPFVQADTSTARRFGGSGLGLAVCHRLASLLGGSIRLAASAPDRGSVFELRLPLAVADANAAAAGSPAITAPLMAEPPRATPSAAPPSAAVEEGAARVLAVDDQEPYRIILRQLLTRAGVRCDVAANAEQALDALDSQTYAMLFTDCQMPGISGCELARRIRRQEQHSNRLRLPIVGVTADDSVEQRQSCLDSGMDDCLVKPVALSDLQRCINAWIN